MLKTGPRYREKVSQMITWGHWFALFNILASLVIGSRYFLAADWPPTLLGRAYAFISWIGHFGFLGFASYLLILFPLTFLVMSQRLLRIGAVIFATVGLTLLLVDTEVFNQFHLHLSPVVWQILVNPDDGELSRNWQLLFIAVPVIFLVELLFATWSWQKLRSLGRRNFDRYFAILFICCFITSHLVYMWADATLYRPITMQKANLPLYYPMTAKRFLERYGFMNQDEYLRQLNQQGTPDAATVHYPRNDLTYAPQSLKNYNILLVVINGLRADAINSKTMPELNQQAAFATRFENNYSTGNNANTGLFGLFYGISPTYLDGILSIQKSSEFIDALQHQDYQMGLFSANGFSAPLYRRALFNGFYLPKSHPKNLATSDAAVTQRWQQWIEQPNRANKPWFTYVNYSAPASFDKGFTQRSRGVENHSDESVEATSGQELQQKYQSSVQKVDLQIKKLFDTLQQKHLLNNTVVIITSDHGMEFNETGRNHWGYNQNFSQYELKVPLLVYWPEKAPTTVNKLTSNADVSATLMQDVLGVTNPLSDYTQGENLFTPDRKNDWVLAGNANQLVIISNDQQMHLDNRGNFSAYDTNYKPLPEDKPRLTILLQALKEVRRFITDEN